MISVERFGAVYGVLLFLILWQVAASSVGTPLLFPEPADVFRGLWRMTATGEIFFHLGATLQRIMIPLAIGMPLGAVLGCAMGVSRDVNAWFDPYLRMANSIPAIALIPFALLWFGVSELARYSLIFYVAVYVVALNARRGVAQVPELRLKAANTLGVFGLPAFFRVVVPSSFPAILAGMRTATGLNVMVVVRRRDDGRYQRVRLSHHPRAAELRPYADLHRHSRTGRPQHPAGSRHRARH